MLEAIAHIERYATRGRYAFDEDELLQVGVVHHLETIGEAAARLDPNFLVGHQEIPWAQIVAMRNILIHEYFGIDLDQVWQTVERHLPILKTQLQRILQSHPDETFVITRH